MEKQAKRLDWRFNGRRIGTEWQMVVIHG